MTFVGSASPYLNLDLSVKLTDIKTKQPSQATNATILTFDKPTALKGKSLQNRLICQTKAGEANSHEPSSRNKQSRRIVVNMAQSDF